jgi:putative FmdB family regulatory protein
MIALGRPRLAGVLIWGLRHARGLAPGRRVAVQSAPHGGERMPIFEYVCRRCRAAFETLVQGETAPSCPSCASTELDRQLSVFAVGRSAPAPSAHGAGPCGTCGDPRGPGSCSLD